MAVLIGLTYVVLLLLVLGVEQVKATASEQLMLWLAPLVWFPIFLAWFLVKTPALMAQEAEQIRATQIDRLEGRIAAIRKEEAKLDAKIHQILFGQDYVTGDTMCFLNMTMKNTGAPSAVLHWRIECSSESEHFNDIMVFKMVDSRSFDGIELTQSDAINEKATQPIPTGGFVRGWFWFIIKGLSPEKMKAIEEEIEIRVLFEDAFGNRGLTSVKLSGSSSSPYPKYYPDGTGGSGIKLKDD